MGRSAAGEVERTRRRWRDGVELACLAEMTFDMPLRYQLKLVRKRLGKWIGAHPEAQPGLAAPPQQGLS